MLPQIASTSKILPETNKLSKSALMPQFNRPNSDRSSPESDSDTTNCKALSAFTYIERTTHWLFEHWGRLVARYPYVFLILPLIIAPIGCIGLINFQQENSIRRQFTPLDSPSHYEYAVSQEFYQQHGSIFSAWLIIMANDTGNLLRESYVQSVLELMEQLESKVTIQYKGKRYSFSDVCQSYCDINTPTKQFLEVHQVLESNRNSPARSRSSFVSMKYPQIEMQGKGKIYIANSLHDVNTTSTGEVTEVRVIQLFYNTIVNAEQDAILRKWELSLYKAVNERQLGDDNLRVYINAENLVSLEVERTGMTAAPLLLLTFVIIMAFTVFSMWRSDPSKRKIFECVLGVIGPIISAAAAIGFVQLFGVKFQPICTVMVFLTLAVGVDDVYIMLQAWRRTSSVMSVEDRMAHMMSESGPSITITSLTNGLSFAIGMFSTTPAIQTFCLYTVAAISACYFCQLTFFAAVMVFGGRREQEGRASCLCCIMYPAQDTVTTDTSCVEQAASSWVHYWSKFLLCWPTRIAFVLIMGAYWAGAFYGFRNMEAQIDVRKLLLDDSPLVPVEAIFRDVINPGLAQMVIFVNKPGNLINQTRREEMYEMMVEFENVPFAWGENSTTFWLRDYMRYITFFNGPEDTSGFDNSPAGSYFEYRSLPPFLKTYSQYEPMIKYNKTDCDQESPACLHMFALTTGIHDIATYNKRAEALKHWRAVCDRYSQFNVTIFDGLNFFADQVDSIAATTQSSALVALLAMAVICVLFIPNITSIVFASGTVLSINVGVFGYLSLWGIDIDPLSMAALLMSIGFSVDYTAHMSYHYYKVPATNELERLESAFSSIGWPMIQSGVSTVMAVVVLTIHKSYLLEVFFKTITLVCGLGLAHGLFALPLVLAAMPKWLQPPATQSVHDQTLSRHSAHFPPSPGTDSSSDASSDQHSSPRPVTKQSENARNPVTETTIELTVEKLNGTNRVHNIHVGDKF